MNPRGANRELRVNGRLTIPARELDVQFVRASGPGGQRINKVATKVVLRFSVDASGALGAWRKARLKEQLANRLTRTGDLVVQASRFRDQYRNLEDARERLATLIRDALRTTKPRVATKPTRGSRERRLRTKRQRSETKRLRRADPE